MDDVPVEWAPRVPQELIRRLYELDAQGICDEELLDEAGWALHARCQSFIAAVEAVQGRVACPRCGRIVRHNGSPEETLRCAGCGWETTWGAFFRTIQHRQLSGAAPVLDLFQDFVGRFPLAGSAREKMLLVDALIHGFHQSLRWGPTRATAVNLIEGRYHEVVDFLDGVAYGEGRTPGTRETWRQWRRTIDDTGRAWGDERLRRPEEN
jgi:predicted RNA-binding Zn-ribbon protein involved in translation (DUF1610 family)